MSSVYEKSNTLVGTTIYFQESADSDFSLTINKSGILLTDGFSEIPIEIGENGPEGNELFIRDVDSITERETRLIYEIAKYQYEMFKNEFES